MSALLSPADLAERFGEGASERQVKDWTRRYGWPHVLIGRRVLFTEDQVEAIVMRHTVTAKSAPATAEALAGQTRGSRARSA